MYVGQANLKNRFVGRIWAPASEHKIKLPWRPSIWDEGGGSLPMESWEQIANGAALQSIAIS